MRGQALFNFSLNLQRDRWYWKSRILETEPHLVVVKVRQYGTNAVMCVIRS